MSAPPDEHAAEDALVVVFTVASNHDLQGSEQLVLDLLLLEIALLDLKVVGFYRLDVRVLGELVHLVSIAGLDLNILDAGLEFLLLALTNPVLPS